MGSHHPDLNGIFLFLNYRPFIDDPLLCRRFCVDFGYRLRHIIGTLVLRHKKAFVRDELSLPPQRRVVIKLPFSTAEDQGYSSLFAEMCRELGVTEESARNNGPPETFWDGPMTSQVRQWLLRLRQACLHPSMGHGSRNKLGRTAKQPRTAQEVLAGMIEGNEQEQRMLERQLLSMALKRGHIFSYAGDDANCSEKAREIYELAAAKAARLVSETREKLARTEQAAGVDESTHLRNTLRSDLALQHQAAFFAGTAAYQSKESAAQTTPGSEEFRQLEEKERLWYEQARQLRGELLRQWAANANTDMDLIREKVDGDSFIQIPELPAFDQKGPHTSIFAEKSNAIMRLLLKQDRLLRDWRLRLAQFLLKPLIDAEDIELTGDEYEASTKAQDEVYVYFDAIQALGADLTACVTGDDSPRIEQELQIALAAARDFLDPTVPDIMKRIVHAPQLMLQLLGQRNELRSQQARVGSIRGLIQQARILESSLNHKAGTGEEELSSLQDYRLQSQEIFDALTKALAGIHGEIRLFRSAQNHRLEYYKQMQVLSDDVRPYKDTLDVELDRKELALVCNKEAELAARLTALQPECRFLIRVQNGDDDASDRDCIICRGAIQEGVLTVCGHQFCRECLNLWRRSSGEGHFVRCPMCKAPAFADSPARDQCH